MQLFIFVKPTNLRAFFLAACVVLSVVSSSCLLLAEISESNVLVVYNEDQGVSGAGYQIADYYQQTHPGVHVVGLTGIDDILLGTYQETVSGSDYLTVIRPQVQAAIAAIPDSIDVIVTTKGLPLKIDAGPKPPGDMSLRWQSWSSLESELTRIDSIDSIDKMGDQFIFTGFPEFDTTRASNPYYNQGIPFVRNGSDPANADIRLSARLDGYSISSVKAAIDRAQQVYVVPFESYIVADDDPTAGMDQMADDISGGPGPGLVNLLQSVNQAHIYENNDTATTTAPGPVIGYVSHGTNDGIGGLEEKYIKDQLQFELSGGSVFLTHESWNASSFDDSHSQTQGLIAEWLENGGTTGLGHVYEPYNGPDNVTNEDLLFQALLPPDGSQPGDSGLTFAEAAWNATRQLSYVNTVVGDPLMRWRQWFPGDTNLDGAVDAADASNVLENWGGNDLSTANGNFNGDQYIDSADIGILFKNWTDAPAFAAAVLTVVPEPTSLIIACLCCGPMLFARRRASN